MYIAKQYFLDVLLLFCSFLFSWMTEFKIAPYIKKANDSALLDFYVFKKAITPPPP